MSAINPVVPVFNLDQEMRELRQLFNASQGATVRDGALGGAVGSIAADNLIGFIPGVGIASKVFKALISGAVGGATNYVKSELTESEQHRAKALNDKALLIIRELNRSSTQNYALQQTALNQLNAAYDLPISSGAIPLINKPTEVLEILNNKIYTQNQKIDELITFIKLGDSSKIVRINLAEGEEADRCTLLNNLVKGLFDRVESDDQYLSSLVNALDHNALHQLEQGNINQLEGNQRIKTLHSQILHRENELVDVKKANSDVLEKMAQLTQQLNEKNQECNQLQERCVVLEKEKNQLTVENQQLNQQMNEFKSILSSIQKQITIQGSHYQEEMKKMQIRISNLESERNQSMENNLTLLSKVSALQDQVSSFEIEEKSSYVEVNAIDSASTAQLSEPPVRVRSKSLPF